MNKTVLTFLLWALFASVSSLRAADCATMAGGVPVVVPPPHQEFVEVGGDKRNFFEVAVPSRNRLLCAFVPTDFLPRLKNPSSGLGKYTLVEVSRAVDEKNTEVTPARFEQVVIATKQQLGDSSSLSQTAESTSIEISGKLKQLAQSTDISVDKPVILGTLLQMPDAYAFAMVDSVSSGGVTTRTISACALLRVRDRLIFAYIYGSGDDEESLKWVEKTTEQWAREILVANSRPAK
jgi:hypothetical protein